MRRSHFVVPVLLFSFLYLTLFTSSPGAQKLEHRPDAISGGADASRLATPVVDYSQLKGSPVNGFPDLAFVPGVGFKAYNFDNNGTETGFLFIPPDPIGAAGTDRLIAVVNVGIECRSKSGTLIFRDALKDFFSPVSTLGTYTFDPKVVYDHYENRFVVVALERWLTSNGDPSNQSRILVAVSKTASPATPTSSDWWYLEINSKINISGNDYWADYPGFEIDEEAVYITNNMFPFSAGTFGVRLWIIDKGVVGGFYAGSTASWNVYDPIPAGFFAMTSQPALVFGAGGAGTNIGTYLVGYGSLTYGGPAANELAQIIRVDNPLTGPTFTGQWVDVGDLEDVGGVYGFPNIPDAPQNGTSTLIEVNDSRALDAVWRNNSLWFTTTINPNTANDATNAGQATAHWVRLNTSVPATITVTDQGNIGGEDIASNASTFFPAVAVNAGGDVKFGFAASASSIYCGAYYAGREAGDPAGTVQAAGVVQAGLDYYQRTFGGPRNRWGDYSGASVDPSDDTTFWIFNQYAETRGAGTAPEDGRWGTAWRQSLKQLTLDFGDAPDPAYPTLLASNGARHTIVQGVSMGGLIDPEADGIPHPNALGDDLTGLPDEDGVFFATLLIPGQPAQVNVTVTLAGWLDVWFDFNQNGSWMDAGEQVFSGPVVGGLNPILVFVVPGTLPGTTYARFRYNVAGVALPPTGAGPDGEVEDYEVSIEQPEPELDFGDAPDSPYPTLLASNGAVHTIVSGVYMGAQIDGEPDGQPTIPADGDDLAGVDDEDGVNFTSPLDPTRPATVDVVVSFPGFLDAWIDFDANGVWDPHDQIFASQPVAPGVNSLQFTVPGTSSQAFMTYARFRYSTIGGLQPNGAAPDGEVEDYEALVEEDVVTGATGGDVPTHFALHDAVPNPFNPQTTLSFSLPEARHVRLVIYDVRGHVVATLVDEDRGPGVHTVAWDGRDDQQRSVASGVYLYRINAGSFVETKRMVLLK